MSEQIAVTTRSDLIVSKTSKRTYFTITDDTDRKLICFNPAYYNKLEVGSVVQLDIQPGRSAEDTPRIESLIEEGAPEATPPSVKPTQEVAPQERGMWWKEIGELIRADKLVEVFGEKDAPFIRKAYKLQAIASLGITAKKED